MGADTVTIWSTTDTQEQVQEALTGQKPAAAPAAPATPSAAAPPAPTSAATPTPAAAAPTSPPAEPTSDQPPANETAEQRAERVRQSGLEKRKGQIQGEIDRLTAQKHDLRRDTEAERAEVERLRAEKAAIQAEIEAARKPAPPSTPPTAAPATTPDDPPEPQLTDINPETGDARYANYEEFLKAHAKWTRETAAAAAKREAQALLDAQKRADDEKATAERERIDRERRNRAEHEVLAQHTTRIEEFKTTHADFDAVMEAAAPHMQALVADLGDHALQAIDTYTVHDAVNGPALMYHLAQHPEEVERIAKLRVPQQIRELGRIEERLAAASSRPGPSAEVTPTTRAPQPVPPAGSSPTRSTVSPDDEPYEVYKERRNKEERRARGLAV